VNKQCIKCNEVKPEEEFSFRSPAKRNRKNTCKACVAAYHREYFQNNKPHYMRVVRVNMRRRIAANKAFLIHYLNTHPCVDCGESDPLVLEFDHVRGEKRYQVGEMVTHGYALATIKAEIAKCEVCCANCHRKRTVKKRGYWKWEDAFASDYDI